MSVHALRRIAPAFAVFSLSSAALVGPPPVWADASTQAQQAIQAACYRAVVGYQQRNLADVMAMYSPNFVTTGVTGRRANFRQSQAGIADTFARDDYHTVARCTVSQVVPQGDGVRAVLQWHFVTRHSRSAKSPAYTLGRDYQEQSVWKKVAGGWQETSAQMTRDVLDYRR